MTSPLWRTPVNPTHNVDLAAREARFGSVSQLTDRILNPKVKGLNIVDSVSNVPAWTDGSTIWLNRSVLPLIGVKATDDTLIVWMGANYHELGHTLYSPRASSKLMKRIEMGSKADPDYAQLKKVENLVEDQRQERLMVKRYRYMTPYLIKTVTTIIVEQVMAADTDSDGPHITRETSIGKAWPWLAGRTWMPAELRKASLDAFDGPGVKLAELIGKYQRMVDPANADASDAYDVLCQIHDLIKDLSQFQGCDLPIGCSDKHGEEPTYKKGGQPKPEPMADDDPDDGPAGFPVPSGGSDGDQALSDEDGEDGEEDGEDGEGDDWSGTQVPDQSPSAGSTSPKNMADLDKVLDTVVREAAKSNPEFKEHLERVSDAVNLDKSDAQSQLRQGGQTHLREASAELKGTAMRLSQTFRKFIDLAMPSWEFGTDSGRLNVARWVHRTGFDFDTMFDRFEEGTMDDVSLDVTVLIDVSSSMGSIVMPDGKSFQDYQEKVYADTGVYPTQHGGNHTMPTRVSLASEAAWVIRKAVHRAEGTTTVVAYNTNAFLVNQTGTKPHLTKVEYLADSGGTDPSDAILDTYQRLKGVEAANTLVIALTDGDWHAGGDVMKKITEAGVTTVGVRVAANPTEDTWMRETYQTGMGVQYYVCIKSPMEMVDLFEKIVSDRLASVTAGLR